MSSVTSEYKHEYKPENWQEMLLFGAVDPEKTPNEQLRYKVALVVGAILFTIVSVGTGLFLIRELYVTHQTLKTKLEARTQEVANSILHNSTGVNLGLGSEPQSLVPFEKELELEPPVNPVIAQSTQRDLLEKELNEWAGDDDEKKSDAASILNSLVSQKLTLSGVEIPPAIGKLSDLKCLVLEKAPLAIPPEFKNLQQLTGLYLEDARGLQTFPLIFCELANLNDLAIKRSEISSIPLEIKCLKKLDTLIITHAKLQECPPDIFNENMKILILDGNSFEKVPEYLSKLSEHCSISLRENHFSREYIEQLQNTPGGYIFLSEKDFNKRYSAWAHNNERRKRILREISDCYEQKKDRLRLVECDEIPPFISRLTHLTSLELTGSFNKIPSEIGNLCNLTYLDINAKNLLSLPEETCSLRELKNLMIFCDSLETLPENIVFLENLDILILNSEKIKILPKSFKDLQKLEFCHLTGPFEDFPLDLCNLPNLLDLSISCSNITKVPDEISQLKKLIGFSMFSAKLTEIPEALMTLNTLISLNLAKNQISTVPNSICHLTNLKDLNLANNFISDLPSSFTKLNNLGELTLDDNSFEKVPEYFSKLSEQCVISLRENHFSRDYIEQWQTTPYNRIFLSVKDLYTSHFAWTHNDDQRKQILRKISNCYEQKRNSLELSGCDEIPPFINRLTHLASLELTGSFKKVPSEIGNLYNLTDLRINAKNLLSLPEEICSLRKLKNLMIFCDNLETLPENIGLLENLDVLMLKSKKIKILPKSFKNLQNLGFCYLTGPFEDFPLDLCNLPKLTDLSISCSNITKVPDEISRLKKLIGFSMFSAKLTEIPEVLMTLNTLTRLNLAKNQISTVPNSICHLTNLKDLDLANNFISDLPSSIAKLNNLRRLGLNLNLFKRVPESIFTFDDLAKVSVDFEDNLFEQSYIDDHFSDFRNSHELGAAPAIKMSRNSLFKTANSFQTIIKAWNWEFKISGLKQSPKFTKEEIGDESNQANFFQFLLRLSKTEDYTSRKTNEVKKIFLEELRWILTAMKEAKDFRYKSLGIMDTVLADCHDAIIIGYNKIKIEFLIKNSKNSLQLAQVAIGIKRLELIQEWASSFAGDLIENELYLQIKLADKLDLPLIVNSMSYLPSVELKNNCEAIYNQIKSATEKIHHLEILCATEFWKDHLRINAEDIYNEIIETTASKFEYIHAKTAQEQKAMIGKAFEAQYRLDTEAWLAVNASSLN